MQTITVSKMTLILAMFSVCVCVCLITLLIFVHICCMGRAPLRRLVDSFLTLERSFLGIQCSDPAGNTFTTERAILLPLNPVISLHVQG